MVGNNIQVYRTILSELQQKSTTRQEAYLRWVIGKFKVSDTRYFAGLGIDIEIIVKVLEEGLE
jgi:hypothetical protein